MTNEQEVLACNVCAQLYYVVPGAAQRSYCRPCRAAYGRWRKRNPGYEGSLETFREQYKTYVVEMGMTLDEWLPRRKKGRHPKGCDCPIHHRPQASDPILGGQY